MIICTVLCTKASAFCLSERVVGSSFAEPYGHGVSGWPATAVLTPPCMSLHWSGEMKTKSGVVRSR